MIFHTTMKRAFTGAALLCLVAAPSAISADVSESDVGAVASAPQSTKFRVDYTGSLFVFPLGQLTVAGEINDYGYSVRADMQSAGLGKLSKDGGMWSTSLGYYDQSGMKPTEHIIKKLDKKGRIVKITYPDGKPVTSIQPRFGSMGQPPASEAERAEAVDVLSGIVQMMMMGHEYGSAPCEGTLKMFDGKQRYDLNLKSVGEADIRQSSYTGRTVRCHMFMENISGYDTEDLLTQEEAATPLDVYMANFEEAGLWIPVRFDYKVSGIKVNIKATHIDIKRG